MPEVGVRVPLELSPWRRHVLEWEDCMRCPLSQVRQKVVLARGKLPCDVLFVGEAPGQSEDALGVPFVGPAGHLLDRLIAEAFEDVVLDAGGITENDVSDGRPIRCAFTNVVACIPRGQLAGDKLGQPPDAALLACQPRLVEMVELAQPRLLVAVGKLAADWTAPGLKRSPKFARAVRRVEVIHPAAILRAPEAARGLMERRNVETLRTAAASI